MELYLQFLIKSSWHGV